MVGPGTVRGRVVVVADSSTDSVALDGAPSLKSTSPSRKDIAWLVEVNDIR